MKLSILIILLALSQGVQSQTVTFSVTTIGKSNLNVTCYKALYEDSIFVGYIEVSPSPVVKITPTEYKITLETNEYYLIPFVVPGTDEEIFKLFHLNLKDAPISAKAFKVPLNFNDTKKSLLGMFNTKTKSYQFTTVIR
jgi:hypothetical protein